VAPLLAGRGAAYHGDIIRSRGVRMDVALVRAWGRSAAIVAGLVGVLATPAAAGVVGGKIDLPPGGAGAPPARTRGFLDRIDNPHLPARPFDPMPHLVVVLVGGDPPAAQPQVTWELAGESFTRGVLPVLPGTAVLIKNVGKGSPVLRAAEAPDLIQPGPINPRAGKELKVGDGPLYTISDPDAPHLVGRIVVVPGGRFGIPDASGRFEIADVPPGTYTVRVWYMGGWIERSDEQITVAAGRRDVNPKIPPGFPAGPAKQK
jgi:hypothetical protein